MSGRGQITVPVSVRRAAGLKPGDRVDIFPGLRGEITATIRSKSRSMDFAGDLAHLDQDDPKERG